MKAAVLGNPVSHSLSPVIFNFLNTKLGENLEYSLQQLDEKTIDNFLQKISIQNDYRGFNITIPFKEYIYKKCDSLSTAAKVIGAVNVVQIEGKKLIGHNTDVIGIQKTFEKAGLNLAGKACLILGAGGAAKAVLYYLGSCDAKKVSIYNRSDRGSELVNILSKHFPNTTFEFSKEIDAFKGETFSALVNTTPLGMSAGYPAHNFFDFIPSLSFTSDALAFDLIYTEEKTAFLKICETKNLKLINGLDMLIDQALATWEIWQGPLANWNELHTGLKDCLIGILKIKESKKNICLAGMMGAGKSTTGKILASFCAKEFWDLDQAIVDKAGKTIAEIFETQGESYFRSLETQALGELLSQKSQIIALGGGSLMLESNLETVYRNSVLIHLSVNAEVVVERIITQSGVRPLLAGLNREEKIERINELLKIREAQYGKAHFTINTAELSPLEVVFQILSKIGAYI